MAESKSPSSLIIVEKKENGIVHITINRPKALNALTRPMLVELAKSFNQIGKDPSVKVVVLTGAGRAFCAGVDLTAAQSVFKGDVKNEEEDPVVQMESCPVPIIGAINGHAVTAGFEIALACDILIASTQAKFADTHAKFGIFPSWGLSQKLPRLIGVNRAREVSLTANPIDATTAERWGLVSRVVPPEQLTKTVDSIANAIANNHKDLVWRYKAVINEGLNLSLGEGRKLERERAHEYYSKVMSAKDFAKMQEFIAGRSKASGQPQAKL